MSKKATDKTSTEVVPAAGGDCGVVKHDPSLTSGWGGMEAGVHAEDVLIPKLLIMQPISERVTDRESDAGDIIRSTTNEKLAAHEDVPLRFIPLCLNKTWVVMEKVGQKFEFRRVEPFTAANANAPWTWYEKDGSRQVEWQRNQALNLFALLSNDISRERQAMEALEKNGELPDVSAALLPVVIQFTRTSFKIGKEVSTHFARSSALNIPAAATTLSLTTEFVKGEKGAYYVYKLAATQKTLPRDLVVAKKWYEVIMKGQAKVHEEALEDVPSAVADANPAY